MTSMTYNNQEPCDWDGMTVAPRMTGLLLPCPYIGSIYYYYTSHKFPMQNLHRPEGKHSYYHPAIISTITCAALMRVRVESVRRSITMTALKHIFRPMKMPITVCE